MLNTLVPGAAEGVPDAMKLVLKASDEISECVEFSRLVFMAIESMELGPELKVLSAGVYAIEKKLEDARILLDQARGWPIGH